MHPYTLASRPMHQISQNLPKSMAAPTLTEKKMKKHGHTTLCISNSGLSDKTKVKI